MQGIEREIAERYNLDVESITPGKDAFIVNTTDGKKVLKKSILSPERILFVHGAKEHLYRNNFKTLDRYRCAVDGAPYITVNDSCFTVSDVIAGRECNFDNRGDVIYAAKLLSSMHKASRGYIALEGSAPRDELGKLPVYFSKRLEEIKKLKKIARKGKSRFDYLFLEYFDYFYNLGESVIKAFPVPVYDRLVREVGQEGMFCHHDFTHRNIICGENSTYIINFEFCCFELKVYDVANFLRRKMRKCNWDINEAKVIVDKYRSIEPISDDELFIMQLILQFPQKLWRVVNKYYNSRRCWSEKSCVAKLEEVIDEIEYHKRFMERFEMLV